MSERFSQFSGKSVYVAPANPAGRALAQHLREDNVKVVAMVDNLKQGRDIINHAEQANGDIQVIVAEGRFQAEICRGLVKKGFRKEAILCHRANQKLTPFRQSLTDLIKDVAEQALRFSIRTLCRILPAKKAVFYAEEFVDTNLLLAWHYYAGMHPDDAELLGINLKGQDMDGDLAVRIKSGWRAYWVLLRARVIVIDHEYTSLLFSEVRLHKPVVQLWHGLPYKSLAGNAHFPNICDTAFVSSSRWFNEHRFPHIFRAEEYLDYGYPRCDALLQPKHQRNWLNSIPEEVFDSFTKNSQGIWVYMPTYRDSGDNSYLLNFDALESLCQQCDKTLIFKFHPFISRKFRDAMGLKGDADTLQAIPGYTRLFLFPSARNIYPWLADAEILITDYSSVALDFLVLDKPIVYYQYDKEAYRHVRGEPMIKDSDFIAGPLVTTESALLATLRELTEGKDAFKHERDALIEKFAIRCQPSLPDITAYIRAVA
ncbi:CDP-glycerol glycerophosphotransferase family protein [Lacimicrobium sp. SS2-24]|uniref:CDP-glycerol glycerophosphotransferase family protein n=1 Tax=Lacimicrobium sp. SS2-24 TaxID=2005569 RepID=UPI000B4B7834|nr:CDP-glycerol glycerophosphotransferase family protein [Lacimicrobium sp. SS2-24]